MPCYRRRCSPSRPLHCDAACCACVQQHILIFDIRDFDEMCRRRTGSAILQAQIHAGHPLRGAIFHATHATGGHVPVDYSLWPTIGLHDALPIVVLIPPVLPSMVRVAREVLTAFEALGLSTATALNMAAARLTLRQIERLPQTETTGQASPPPPCRIVAG